MNLSTIIYQVATDQDAGLKGAGAWRVFLLALSWVYRSLVAFARFCYRCGFLPRHDLGRLTVSVGNLTWGGTGKTPLVEWLCRELVARQKRPVVLTRGYMADGNVGNGLSDESRQLEAALGSVPVMVGKDRVASARKALQDYGVDVFVLDDGFQHWRVKRNLDIVVINASNPFGNGHLIPRGILREPARSLKQADLIVLTKTDLGRNHLAELRTRLAAINPQISIVETVHVPRELAVLGSPQARPDVKSLRGKRVLAFCAIGDPASFRKTLEGAGAQVAEFVAFRDHHRYSESDVQDLLALCRKNDLKTLVTTEKDAVKVKDFGNFFSGHELWCLKIGIEITYGKEILLQRISDLLQR